MSGKDHPRVGGEKDHWCHKINPALGSPPRGRGKDNYLGTEGVELRITPAWAGKSLTLPEIETKTRDHPRVGGEKKPPRSMGSQTLGSPPRGRGKVLMPPLVQLLIGITPAWAGKSRPCGRVRWPQKDHPRVGGEKCWPNGTLGEKKGSPPRGRGKADRGQYPQPAPGITPAWAGKRSSYQ